MTQLFPGAQRADQFEEADDAPAVGGSPDEGPSGGNAARQAEKPSMQTEGDTSSVFGLSDAYKGELIRPGSTETVYASWGSRGFWMRVSGGLLKLRPGAEEQAHLDAERVIRQATFPRAVNVLVGNKGGGVGKTVTSVCLAGTLGSIRGGGTAAFEVSDAAGSLEKRAEGTPSRGMGELVPAAPAISSSGELASYAAPQTSLADIIGSVHDRPVLTGQDVHNVRSVLDQYYRVTVSDSGNNPHSEAFAAAVETADVLVVPTLLYPSSILDALDLLERVSRLSKHGEVLADRAVLVCNNDGKPIDPEARKKARGILSEVQERIPDLAVMDVPYDAHIGKHGEITLDSLSLESRKAWTKIAAEVTQRLLAYAQ